MKDKLKQIYSFLPGIIKSRVDEMWYRLPVQLKYGTAYIDMLNLLKESETWSKEKIYDWQTATVKKLLLHAYNTTKFYKCSFDNAGFDPNTFSYLDEMEKIPVIDKKIVQENLNDMLSDSFSKGMRQKMTTGGTTGNQMTFYAQKGFTIPREIAFFDYLWGKAGYLAGKSEKVILRNNVIANECLWEYDNKSHAWIIDPYHLTEENCEKIIIFLNKIKIPFFHVYPSSILALADYMNKNNHRLEYVPKAIFASSENLYKGQREIIENTFGCKLLLHYGHSEMCCVAPWCLKENHYHLNEVYGFTELLDENNDVINVLGKIGEITATGFNNYAMPLIRYKTADYASYSSENHSCGYSGRIIENIEGRWLQEMLVTSQGNKISMTAINFHSDVFDNVKFYQFYQDKPGFVTMKIVKEKSYGAKDEYAIKEAMQEKLGKYLALAVEYVDEIEKAPNGKFRYIISKL